MTTRKFLFEAGGVLVLLVFAVVGVPSVKRPVIVPPADAPSDALLAKAAAVGVALANASDIERAVWAEVWEKAGRAVEAEGTTADPFVTNGKELRAFTIAAHDVAWKRLTGVKDGAFPGLREAVEAFLVDTKVLGRDDVYIDAVYRANYGAACRALAYAGRKKG